LASNALTPDNYLITSLLDLGEGDSLYYVIFSFSAAFEAENYSILVSTTGTDIADFTDEGFTEVLTSDEWESRSIDFSAYNDQSIYIAFRPHNVTDEWGILMDGIALPGEVFCEPSSVENLSKVEAQLYPNPTRDQVSIKTAMNGFAQVNIFDATGRMVAQISVQLNGQIFAYDVAILENGFYTLQITTENQVAVQKFLKQ